MRAIIQNEIGGPDVLEITHKPTPVPATGEILVRIAAVGINPVDAAIRAGQFPFSDPPFTLGWDIAGTVEEVGPDVEGFDTHERVFGLARFPDQAAAYAEFASVPASEMVAIPDGMTNTQAAALPLAGLTAWQALVETAGLEAGQNVLVHAGAGGVGHLAIQIAKARGAHVATTVSESKMGIAHEIGADSVINYESEDFSTKLGEIDVVVDAIGGDHAGRSLDTIHRNGVVVCLIPPSDGAREKAKRSSKRLEQILVHPDAASLKELAALFSAGKLKVQVTRTFPLEKAGEAHEFLSTSPVGKIVLET